MKSSSSTITLKMTVSPMVKQTFPQVRPIENTDNVGFAGANNQGIDISQGRYVLLLNSDAFVQERTIDAMIAFMDAHSRSGHVGLSTAATMMAVCNHRAMRFQH